MEEHYLNWHSYFFLATTLLDGPEDITHPFFFYSILLPQQNDAVILSIGLPDVLKLLSVLRQH